jgi:hypothetical protein
MSVILVIAVYLALLRSDFISINNGATVVGMILVVPWLVAPLAIKSRQWSSPHPQFEEVDPLTVEEPEEFAESARELELAMADLGFRSLGHFRGTNHGPRAESLVTLFADESQKQIARWLFVKVRTDLIRKATTTLVFTTDFTDGTKLATSNYLGPSGFPRIRMRDGSGAFPRVRGPRRLYDVHQACLARFCSDAIRLLPSTKEPVEYLLQSLQQEQAKLAEAGYYYLDEKHDVYRLTWKGAYLMGWKLLWPVKPIREMIRRSRAARLLKELGFNEEGLPA